MADPNMGRFARDKGEKRGGSEDFHQKQKSAWVNRMPMNAVGKV